MMLLFGLLIFIVLIAAEPKPKLKRAILCVLGAGWFTLTVSNYGLLTGQITTYIPGKFSSSGRSFERLKCSYWIGLGGIRVHKAGPPNSISCPLMLNVKNKWNSPDNIYEEASIPAVIVKEK
jgi:hypothetical protein